MEVVRQRLLQMDSGHGGVAGGGSALSRNGESGHGPLYGTAPSSGVNRTHPMNMAGVHADAASPDAFQEHAPRGIKRPLSDPHGDADDLEEPSGAYGDAAGGDNGYGYWDDGENAQMRPHDREQDGGWGGDNDDGGYTDGTAAETGGPHGHAHASAWSHDYADGSDVYGDAGAGPRTPHNGDSSRSHSRSGSGRADDEDAAVDDEHYESDNEPLPPVPQAPRHPTQLGAPGSDAGMSPQDRTDASVAGGCEDGELSLSAPMSPSLDAPQPHGQHLYGQPHGAVSSALLEARLGAAIGSSASSVSSGSGRNFATSPDWPAAGRSPDVRSRTSNVASIRGGIDSRRFVGCSSDSEYEFHKKVGEGTFGEVTIGTHKPTGAVVALKRILVQNEKEGLPITALREIKILKALSHDNVIQLREIAYQRGDRNKRERGNVYMVFPYMDHDLTGLLQNPQVRFTPAQIKSYMQQILLGIDYLHKNKIMHRDVKGSNILIDNSGSLRIADFGLARAFTGNEAKGYTNLVVTRWYRPPELLMGSERYTTSIDIWGVGCVFGEILRRRPIMTGTDDNDQLEKICALCGTPDDTNWPGYRSLPMFNPAKGGVVSDFKVRHPRILRERFPPNHYHPITIDLLDEMLTLDPSRRPTASEALQHKYFYTYPTAARPGSSDFQPWPSSHELELRQAKTEEAATASSAGQPVRSAHSQLPAHFDYNYVNNYMQGRTAISRDHHRHHHSSHQSQWSSSRGHAGPSSAQHGPYSHRARENGDDRLPVHRGPSGHVGHHNMPPHDQRRRYPDERRPRYSAPVPSQTHAEYGANDYGNEYPPAGNDGNAAYDRDQHRYRDTRDYRYSTGPNAGHDDRSQWE